MRQAHEVEEEELVMRPMGAPRLSSQLCDKAPVHTDAAPHEQKNLIRVVSPKGVHDLGVGVEIPSLQGAPAAAKAAPSPPPAENRGSVRHRNRH